MVIVDLQLLGWQSLSSLLFHRIRPCRLRLAALQAPAAVFLPLPLLPLELPPPVPSPK
jgi:hypothetical protein